MLSSHLLLLKCLQISYSSIIYVYAFYFVSSIFCQEFANESVEHAHSFSWTVIILIKLRIACNLPTFKLSDLKKWLRKILFIICRFYFKIYNSYFATLRIFIYPLCYHKIDYAFFLIRTIIKILLHGTLFLIVI